VRKSAATKSPNPGMDTSEERFPTPDRFTMSGKRVGDICFECECRILQIGGPDGMLLAWCDCDFPEDHGEMEIW